MRTTLTLDDQIARDLKELAQRSGKPFKTVVNDTLRAGLAAANPERCTRRYRLNPASLGGVRSGFNLDKALAVSDALEDEEATRKLDLRIVLAP